MIIALAVKENNANTPIHETFGRCNYYMLYNTDTKTSQFITNPGINAAGGAGIKAAQAVADAHADICVAPAMGQNAADVLVGAGIPAYECIEGTAMQNVEAFLAGTLTKTVDVHEGYHGSH